MSHNQNLFNKVAEITGHSLLQDEMAEIFEAIRKDEQPSEKTETLEAGPIDIRSGWKHNAKILTDIVSEMYAEEYENASMEQVDLVLTILEKKYNITDKSAPSPALQDAVKHIAFPVMYDAEHGCITMDDGTSIVGIHETIGTEHENALGYYITDCIDKLKLKI